MSGAFIRRAVLFVTGFCVYITLEVCARGYSYPLMGVLGGLAILILDNINDRLSWDTDILIQGAIGSALITGFELFTGFSLELLDQQPMWDYSNIPLNFCGYICLPFSILWFFAGLACVFLADAINYYVFEELPVPYYKCCGRVVLIFKKKHCKL